MVLDAPPLAETGLERRRGYLTLLPASSQGLSLGSNPLTLNQTIGYKR